MRAAMVALLLLSACGMANTSLDESGRLTRACSLDPSIAVVRCQATTGTDCDTGALPIGINVRVDADTDAWMVVGAAAVTAVANSTKVRAGFPEYFLTLPTSFHYSFLSVSANGDVRISACQ